MTTETKFTVGEYTMRNGREAKVVAQYGEWLFGVVNEGGVAEFPSVWNLDGTSPEDDNRLDLMPPLRECWRVNNSMVVFETEEEAVEKARRWNRDGEAEEFSVVKAREVRDDQA